MGNVSQFCEYIGCPWTIFIKTSTTMKASRPGTNKIVSSDLEHVGRGYHLQKPLYISYYMTDFYQSFIEIMGMLLATNCHVSSFENLCQGHQKSLYLGYYMTDFNQTFTKMILLILATKASHQLTFKM